jgi:hypothetical protein
MRVIKFRGKSLKNQEWIKGYYFKVKDQAFIIPEYGRGSVEVDPKTIGQYSGVSITRGNEIIELYEGDKVLAWFPGMPLDMRAPQEITFLKSYFGCGSYPLSMIDPAFIEITGTIHD